jgi:hypothetical protein
MRHALGLVCVGWLSACSTSAPPADEPPPATQLLAPSLRRLSVAELSTAASALVGAEVELSASLPPDARQQDFSRSLTQSVDVLTLQQLNDAARGIARRLELAATGGPACAAQAPTNDSGCATELVTHLASKAFRRRPTDTELAALRAVFDAGAKGGSFRDGAELVVRALLGSASMLYETALGAATTEARVSLSDDELASHLAWLVGGAPPDAELQGAAAAGELRAGAGRRRQALRLLQNPSSRGLYRRFVEEWLGLNRLRSLAKSSAVAPHFAELREPMLRETEALVDDALRSSGGSLPQLFAGGYSLVPSELGELYGIAPPGAGRRVSLSKLGRVGLLQQASFLATFAHEDESAPVLRGKVVLERLLCRRLPKPAELGIDLVLPAPDATATTRERFARHAESARCAGCHDALDGVGFTFENFDAVGRTRVTEAGKPIDSSGHLLIDGQDLALADSAQLAQALAGSEELAVCAARQLVRFAAGSEVSAVEDDFVQATRGLPDAERRSIVGLLLAYVQGDWFAWRTTT